MVFILFVVTTDAQGELPRGWNWVDIVKVSTKSCFFGTHM